MKVPTQDEQYHTANDYADVCRESHTVKSTMRCVALTLSGDKLLVEGHSRMKLRSKLISGAFFIDSQTRTVIELLTVMSHMPPVHEERPTGLLLTKSEQTTSTFGTCQ